MGVYFYPEHSNEPYPGQNPNDYIGYDSEDEDEDMENEKIYIKPITENRLYAVDPIDPKLGMRQVVFDVQVPTNLEPFEDKRMETIVPEENTTYDLEGAIVRLSEQGIIANPKIIETINGEIQTIQLNINTLANTINEIHNHFDIGAMQVDFTEVNNTINEAILEVNNNIKANFNAITNIKNTYVSNVQINNQFKEEITVGIEQKVKNITEINVANVISSLNVVSQNQNILVSDINSIKDFLIRMYGQRFFKRPNSDNYIEGQDTPSNSRKLIKSSSSTEKPIEKDSMLTDEETNESNNDQENSSNENVQSNRSIKRFRGPTDEDVTEPTRQSYYWDSTFTVDQMNEKYNKDYYGMFELQSIVEVPMLEEVNINIRNNNPNFVWDIDEDYVNTVKNIDQNDPSGYNPLGVRRFRINIAVDTNLLKDINEFSEMTFGNSNIDIASYNTALVKYDQNNEINPQELLQRRLRVIDEYEGDGKTIYDSNEKIFINSHKYTIEEENENCEENNEGFKKVIQTTIVPVMDEITLPDITETNKTLKYSIKDYNDIYSLTPGSQNTYRNDFIGFSCINIPIKVNNKVVAGYGSTPNIYRPSDFDNEAIGFSSFQIYGNVNSGGTVNNLISYTFTSNSNIDQQTGELIPYTIDDYNNEQDPITNYTGFESIIVNVPVNNVKNAENVNITSKLGLNILDYNNSQNPVTDYTGFSSVLPVLYDLYNINDRLQITTNGRNVLTVPSNYCGFGDIYYDVEVPSNVYNDPDNNRTLSVSDGGSYSGSNFVQNFIPESNYTGFSSFKVNVPLEEYIGNSVIELNSSNPVSIVMNTNDLSNGNIGYKSVSLMVKPKNKNVNNNGIITSNGIYNIPSGYSGFNNFEVNVTGTGAPNLENKVINYDGVWLPRTITADVNFDGIRQVSFVNSGTIPLANCLNPYYLEDSSSNYQYLGNDVNQFWPGYGSYSYCGYIFYSRYTNFEGSYYTNIMGMFRGEPYVSSDESNREIIFKREDGLPFNISYITFSQRNENAEYFGFYASNDGVNFVTLLNQNIVNDDGNYDYEYNLRNINDYLYYKIIMSFTNVTSMYKLRFYNVTNGSYSGPNIKVEPTRNVSYNQPGIYHITPSLGFTAINDVYVSIPMQLQEKSVTLYQWRDYGFTTFTPDPGYAGFSSFTVYLTNDPSYLLTQFKLYYRKYIPDNTNVNVDISTGDISLYSLNSWLKYTRNNSTFTLNNDLGCIYLIYKYQHVDIFIIVNKSGSGKVLTNHISSYSVEHDVPFTDSVYICTFPLSLITQANKLCGELCLSYNTAGRVLVRNLYNEDTGLQSCNCYLYDSWIDETGANITVMS